MTDPQAELRDGVRVWPLCACFSFAHSNENARDHTEPTTGCSTCADSYPGSPVAPLRHEFVRGPFRPRRTLPPANPQVR